MNSDKYLLKGTTHQICQDYNDTFKFSFGKDSSQGTTLSVVSDGCSLVMDENGNNLDAPTDIGSRILTRSMYQVLSGEGTSKFLTYMEDIYHSVILRSYSVALDLGLDYSALSATLLNLVTTTHGFTVSMVGDGYHMVRKRGTSSWEIKHFAFTRRPYYLVMELSTRDKLNYLETFPEYGAFETVYKIDLDTKETVVETTYFTKTDLGMSLEEFSPPIRRYFYSAQEYDIVSITSDGLGSFVIGGDRVLKEAPLLQVFERFFSYKNYSGSFVLRRSDKATKELLRENIYNQDDLSICSSYIP